NRRIGKIARHSNGLLSRFQPRLVSEHVLPGFIPGRGAMVAYFGSGDAELMVVNLHLAIGRVARLRQLSYLAELVQAQIQTRGHAVVMGDFNLHSRNQDLRRFVRATGLSSPDAALSTFPSWRPSRNLDHILISPALRAEAVQVVDFPLSDHLPISLDLILPFQLEGTGTSEHAID
ncbi:MAG: endonuclease/exonuclease/phosphatase family protein, partial [Gammaproteobacteria bacterium]